MPQLVLNLGSSGDDVVELHSKLIALGYKPADTIGTFGPGTKTAIQDIQKKNGLAVTGELDNATRVVIEGAAAAGAVAMDYTIFNRQAASLSSVDNKLGTLNSIDNKLAGLEKLGKLDAINEGIARLGAAAGVHTPLLPNSTGSAVADLHEKLRAIGMAPAACEIIAKSFGPETEKAVLGFQAKRGLALTGILDAATQTEVDRAVASSSVSSRVVGRLSFGDGQPAAGLTIEVHEQAYGTETLLATTCTTDSDGFYAIPYATNDKVANLKVYANQNGKLTPLAEPKFSLTNCESLDLIAPESLRGGGTEFERLDAGLKQKGLGVDKLATAKEDESKQDLSVLSAGTGWDARVLSLGASAAKGSTDASIGLDAKTLYGLYRLGLPTEKTQLAHVGSDSVEMALKRAAKAGIVNLNEAEIGAATSAFAKFSVTAKLKEAVPGSNSTYEALLTSTGFTDAKLDALKKAYFSFKPSDGDFWQHMTSNWVKDPDDLARLRNHGKLAFLTGNNAPLLTKLANDNIKDPAQLALRGYHDPDQWKSYLKNLAGGVTTDNKLLPLIPPTYVGATVAERLQHYAEDLARKIRLAYPSHVVYSMIVNSHTDVFGLGAVQPAVADLIKYVTTDPIAAKDFSLGSPTADAYVEKYLASLPAAERSKVNAPVLKSGLRKLRRMYQLSPDADSMKALATQGFSSAHEIVSMSKAVFFKRFAGAFSSPQSADLVYRKAEQVSSVASNLYALAMAVGSASPLAALSPSRDERKKIKQGLFTALPSMETLLGSQDYLECDHSESVLGPAAYLVDLLQFLEPQDIEWKNFLDTWKTEHSNSEYQKDWAYDKRGEAYPGEHKKPYYALIERRPDIPNIELTKDNTEIELPYIDLVNEILEYFVANKKLDGGAARDSAGQSSADILAEPKNTLVLAYEVLNEAANPGSKYPLSLPFDLPIEIARALCRGSGTSLAEVLDRIRTTDALLDPTKPYARFAIFLEKLGISPSEYALFTDPSMLKNWFVLYGYGTASEATTPFTDPKIGQRKDLKSGKTLSRKLDVTYKELADIVNTRFVNPSLDAYGALRKIRVSVRDAATYKAARVLLKANPPAGGAELKRYLGAKAFADRLGALASLGGSSGTDPRASFDKALDESGFNSVLFLDQTDAIDFDTATLRRIGGDAQDIDFLRINIFVRLWKKLGWAMGDVDRALTALVPAKVPFDAGHIGNMPLGTALLYIAHLSELAQRLQAGVGDLLSLWEDIPTMGPHPLYERLFIDSGVAKDDPVFEDSLGRYLSITTDSIALHLRALGSALGITQDDIARVIKDLGRSMDQVKLTIPNVSTIYRYSLLAWVMKISIKDLISYKTLTGLDPFTRPSPDALVTAGGGVVRTDLDYPLSQTLRFIELVESVRAAGFNAEALEYLLLHKFDPSGAFRYDADEENMFLGALGRGLRGTIDTIPDPRSDLSSDELNKKLGLAFSPDAADRIEAMIEGLAQFSVSIESATALDPLKFASEPSLIGFEYNKELQRQTMIVRGALTSVEKARLKADHPGEPFSTLIELAQRQAIEEYNKYLAIDRDLIPEYGFLNPDAYETLFALPDPDSDESMKEPKDPANRRYIFAKAFYPFLKKRLQRQFIVDSLSSRSGQKPSLIGPLLENAALLGGTGALIEVFSELATAGMDARFFSSINCDGSQIGGVLLSSDADSEAGDGKGVKLMPNGVYSMRYEGYVTVPKTGAYKFYICVEQPHGQVKLVFPSLPSASIDQAVATADFEASLCVELNAGLPYLFVFDVDNYTSGRVRLMVQAEEMPKQAFGLLPIVPKMAFESALAARMLLTKTLEIIRTLSFGERETIFLLSHKADFDGTSLADMPTAIPLDPSKPLAATTKLFAYLQRLCDYVGLRSEIAAGTEDLIDVFAASDRDSSIKALERTTRRDRSVADDAANALGMAGRLSDERQARKLWKALESGEKLGVPVSAMSLWMPIVSATAAYADRYHAASDMRQTVRSGYLPETWRAMAKPIFDDLRRRQRDALSAYVMHALNLATMNQLYEYFLIDPGMEPVVLTSRIRLAISATQLFIQRSLLNLEPRVHPSVFDPDRWEWMKRYRVWEANRKIFLYPEDWLEPEFRDDKTHIFKELEGELLQGDVSREAVEDAFYRYLCKLEEFARLDIVAMYCENQADFSNDIVHVLGRTMSEPRKYFYRRYRDEMWTPWEPVSAEVEGDHIALIVWRGRLCVFWTTFIEKLDQVAPTPTDPPDSSNAAAKLSATQLKLSDVLGSLKESVRSKYLVPRFHWSEYMNGDWASSRSGSVIAAVPPSGSSGVGPSEGLFAKVDVGFDVRSISMHVRTLPDKGKNEGVLLFFSDTSKFTDPVYLAGRNSRFEIFDKGLALEDKVSWSPPENCWNLCMKASNRFMGNGKLVAHYRDTVTTVDGKADTSTPKDHDVLTKVGRFTLLPCGNNMELGKGQQEVEPLVTPSFFHEGSSPQSSAPELTLFIEPTVTETTVDKLETWVTYPPTPCAEWSQPDWWNHLEIAPHWPISVQLPPMHPPVTVARPDWLVNEVTAIKFGNSLIGPAGRTGLVLKQAAVATIAANKGSSIAPGLQVAEAHEGALRGSGLTIPSGGLNVIGADGFNSALRNNMKAV